MKGETNKHFQRNEKYYAENVMSTVVRLRGNGETWEGITKKMKEKFDLPTLSKDTTSRIYHRAIAQTITTKKKNTRKFKDYTYELSNMYDKTINVLERYILAAENISSELQKMIEEGDIEAVKAYGMILKTAPQMKAITSEIRDFIKLQQEREDKITVEQTALVWDESQMIDYMNTYLKVLNKEGKIKIIKPII